MSTDSHPSQGDHVPSPKAYKASKYRFGTKPVSPLVRVPIGEENRDPSDSQPAFEIHWEDQQQGLRALVREQENGRLVAHVFCTDAGLLGKAAMSVGLRGATADHANGKLIPLKVPEQNGCS